MVWFSSSGKFGRYWENIGGNFKSCSSTSQPSSFPLELTARVLQVLVSEVTANCPSKKPRGQPHLQTYRGIYVYLMRWSTYICCIVYLVMFLTLTRQAVVVLGQSTSHKESVAQTEYNQLTHLSALWPQHPSDQRQCALLPCSRSSCMLLPSRVIPCGIKSKKKQKKKTILWQKNRLKETIPYSVCNEHVKEKKKMVPKQNKVYVLKMRQKWVATLEQNPGELNFNKWFSNIEASLYFYAMRYNHIG